MLTCQPTATSPSDDLDLVSMYQQSPAGRASGIRICLGPERERIREGELILDPNYCTFNEWGDRIRCTRMAFRHLAIISILLNLPDPHELGRELYRIESNDFFESESASLVGYPSARLWYMLYTVQERTTWIVPLFSSSFFPSPALAPSEVGSVAGSVPRIDPEPSRRGP